MERNRKLVFDEIVYKKEEKRIKRFKTIVILILILCIIIVPFIKVMLYDKIKVKNQTYIDTAMAVWYNGIEDIKYTKLEISILDHDNIKYEDIYKMGINSIGANKIQISILVDDKYWIIQKGNIIKVTDNSGSIAKLEFDESGVKIINEKIIRDIIISIFLIFMLICIAIIVIDVYEENGRIRMIKDTGKLSNPNDTIF
ncbi:MAG: hypothetical protein HFJ41_02850 [Clostridia bacterium]|nr:hypothetical protein [Clostridia bacterium]